MAAAAHQHQAASGSESDDPDKSRKRGESFESDMSSSSIPSNKANLSASSEGAAVLEAIDNVQTFPQKLMEMLDTEVVPEAMWWTDDGSAFAMDLSKFEEVLHKHFQSAKYPSFTRKL